MESKITIAKLFGTKEFPLNLYDEQGNKLYYENADGYWWKSMYIGNEEYHENADGYWYKQMYDEQGNIVYYENSEGEIQDIRIKLELTLEDIAAKFNVSTSQIIIKTSL